jgi:hypothetical protein
LGIINERRARFDGSENQNSEIRLAPFASLRLLELRSRSVNLSILPEILPGRMMSDVVAILGSLDFVMCE